MLVARRGADVALLPDQEPGWRDDARGSWRHLPPQDHLAWWVATDRGLYRPGERVHLKGWVRRIEDGPRGGVVAPQGMTGITFASLGPRREELQRGTAVVTPLSGFHLTVELPDELNLGHAQVHLQAQGRVPQQGRETWHQVPVHEFRRPEFEVRAEVDPGPHVVGGSIAATVHAAYYAGGGLADTEVEWRVHSTEAHFAPPGWDGWQFGRQRWWWHGGGEPPRVRTLRGRTGADGAHHMVVDLAGVDPPFAHLVRAEVEARDVNRQVGSARQQTLVHPAAVYAGLRAERGWVRPGDTLSVQVAAVGIGGQPAAGRPVHVRAERIQWRPVPRFRDGAAPAADSVVAECRLVSDTAPTSCALPVRGDGTLLIVAEVRDEQDRPSRSEMIVWVAGGPPLPPSVERPETGEVGLVSDRTSYQPGQMAEVLVQAPFHPAEGMLTVRRAGLLRSERFRVTGPSHTLRVPLAEAQIPGVHLHVELVDAERGVRSASGTLTLPISPRQRELQLQVSPRDTLAAPGAATEVEVAVRDAAGRPVPGAEVALWMVDESVLALGGYTLPDPLEVFHPARAPGVRDHALRPRVLLARRSAGPGTVRGIVLDAETGMPLHGAQASVRDGQVSAAVRGSGEFTLAGLAPGNFRLRVTHPGYRTLERDVAVPAEGAHLGTILLEREGATGIEREQIEALQARAAAAPAGAPPPPPAAPAMARLRAREGGVELEAPAATAAGYDAGQAPVDPVALRTEFAPLAAFEPSLRTGPDGRIGVPVRLPESLTRYRIVAVAVEGSTRYGRGEANLTARRELMVRPSAPRFLNFGDRAEIPVVVQNTTTAPLTVDVALRASGLRAEGAAAQRVTVPAGDRAELRFAVVAERAGRAHLQVVGIAGRLSDAAGVELPVYTPATTEAFATYGEIDGGTPVVLPLSMPRGVIPGFGGVEVTLSSTALQSLTDAVLYLHHYPFEGAEQLASRILAIAALRDVLGAFAAEGLPEPAGIEASVIRDIGRLVALQGFDGGWGFWRRDEGSHPYVSVHAAHALARARTKGYRVPEPSIERALQFLRGIERTLPQGYGPRERNTLTAYAVYVRHRLAEPGAGGEARRLAQRASTDGLTVEAMGWLLHVLAQDLESRAEAAELLRRIRNRATETAATATFATSYGDADHLLLHSARRSDAVVLEALIAADPRSDLIPKTARGLLAHRTRGRWQGTQENAWVLLALERYFATYEATTPNFVSGVWLGERYAGGYSFRGRTTERHHLEIPMREVARLAAATPAPRPSSAGAAGDVDLLLQREGAGRMYYRAGLRYAPADLTPDPDQRGFSVERSYEALDDPADVQRDADGTWRIRAGTRVRVRLSMIAPERRHHVALVDPLPAGFESVNPDLAGVGFTDEPPPVPLPMPRPGAGLRPSPGEIGIRPGPWWGRWWVHQNLRDDRAEAFATLLPAGSYQYTYIARATTPGVFVVPPPRAEEMYHPETFGRGAGVRVVVEGR